MTRTTTGSQSFKTTSAILARGQKMFAFGQKEKLEVVELSKSLIPWHLYMMG